MAKPELKEPGSATLERTQATTTNPVIQDKNKVDALRAQVCLPLMLTKRLRVL